MERETVRLTGEVLGVDHFEYFQVINEYLWKLLRAGKYEEAQRVQSTIIRQALQEMS